MRQATATSRQRQRHAQPPNHHPEFLKKNTFDNSIQAGPQQITAADRPNLLNSFSEFSDMPPCQRAEHSPYTKMHFRNFTHTLPTSCNPCTNSNPGIYFPKFSGEGCAGISERIFFEEIVFEIEVLGAGLAVRGISFPANRSVIIFENDLSGDRHAVRG